MVARTTTPSTLATSRKHTSNGRCPRATAAQVRRAAGGKDTTVLRSLVESSDSDSGWSASQLDSMASDDGKSALHMAAWYGSLDNIRYLLELGCDVDRIATGRHSYGKTPIFFAVTRCRDDACALLLDAGADVRIVNNKGQSVLSLAATHLEPETVEAVRAAEASQGDEGVEWRDYSCTHSDGNNYGDLDRRFLRRPLGPDDVVTELVVNPTTKQSRRGNFARLNPTAARSAKKKQSQQQQSRRKHPPLPPPLTDAERNEYERSWKEMESGLVDNDASSFAVALLDVVRFRERRKQAWIPDVANRLRTLMGANSKSKPVVEAAVVCVSESSSCTPRETSLVKKLLGAATNPSFRTGAAEAYHEQKTVAPIEPNDSREDEVRISLKTLSKRWQVAIDSVRCLSWSLLQNPSPRRSKRNLSLKTPPTWVDSVDGLSNVRALLDQLVVESSDEYGLVAFDTEWCGATANGEAVLATIQLACLVEGRHLAVFVIDLKDSRETDDGDGARDDDEYRPRIEELLRWLFLRSGITLLGFAIGHDVSKLNAFLNGTSAGGIVISSSSERLLDLQTLAVDAMARGDGGGRRRQRSCPPGLKATCARYLSAAPSAMAEAATPLWELSKEEQCSDWGRRPLRREQLEYAGLDAGVLLVLLKEMTANHWVE